MTSKSSFGTNGTALSAPATPFGIATMAHLTTFAHAVQAAGYRLDVKPGWRKELRLGE